MLRSLLLVVLLPASLLAVEAAPADRAARLLERAEHLAASGEWLLACEVYEQLLGQDRHRPEVRDRYLLCLRHAQQVRRCSDPTYRQQARDLTLTRALELYAEVLNRLRSSYVDRDKVELPALTRLGIDEVRGALRCADFRREFLSAAAAQRLGLFEREIDHMTRQPPRTQAELIALARELALAGQKALDLRPTVLVLEMICGACNGLDEHSAYLTPGQLQEVYESLQGQPVGIGVELVQEGGQLVIQQILTGSPADLAGLKAGSWLTRINQRSTVALTQEAAEDLLRGEVGSTVEVEVIGGDMRARVVKLTRQTVPLPSVSEPRLVGDRMFGIGYLQVIGFQESTVQEIDDALAKLQAAGMKVLILDLRGNPGGLVEVAIQIVQRFLPSGIIASTHGQLRAYNRTYEAHNPNAWLLPLVVLVDGETASSAEMVAGALKENDRGRLVGVPTFGKGSIQHYWRLSGGGLRLTVARFLSPSGQAYSGVGVQPHLRVDRDETPFSMDPEQDAQVRAALETARNLLMAR